MMDFKKIIRDVPDFPQKGIVFRDITPVLQSAEHLASAVNALKELAGGVDFDLVTGPESRGFIFGVPLALALGRGFIPVRKEGKLPRRALRKDYALEYGTAAIEMHADAVAPGQRVLVVDDLLATGGTCAAICDLIEQAGGSVAACVFFIELGGLNGRAALEGREVRAVVRY